MTNLRQTENEAPVSVLKRVAFLAAGERTWPWLALVGLALAVSAVEAAGAILILVLLSRVAGQEGGTELPLIGDLRQYLPQWEGIPEEVVLSAVVAVFFIVRGVIVLGRSYGQARITQSAGARLAARLHRGYLRAPYDIHLTKNSAEQIRNIHETVQQIIVEVFTQGTRAVAEAIVVVVLLVVMAVTAPMATLLAAGILLPVIAVMNRFLRPRLEILGREAQDLFERSLRIVQESLRSLREIRVIGREDYFTGQFAATRGEFARNRYVRATLRDLPIVLLETLIVLIIAAVLMASIAMGRAGLDALPVLGMFAYVGLRLKPSLDQIVSGWNSMRYARPAINDLYQELRPMETAAADAVDDREQESFAEFSASVVFEGVSFTYPEAGSKALDAINLTIDQGSTVGFVGPTGGGKSTLIDVLVGLLEPQEGRVSVDGRELSEIRAAWFAQIGVVAQTTVLIDDSVTANIALGVKREAVDKGRVRESVRLAQLDDFVDYLPDGLDTRVGEVGVMLSGGQRQRIAIARALYRDPRVLILDEGTSALDNQTQAALMESLRADKSERTLVIVAHRLSTVEYCDVIHVVDDGRIVASGGYEQLAQTSKRFRDLVS